ncbi:MULTISPECIES: lysine--tRNA ligase [unclassified Erythrobacter]|uniref:lysine--tRNA ligase n=1 Tax=unclassified Erythrobacter TaxID=2633097 RepID=UPI0007BA81F0|nr:MULTISPECIES: lysine--tRNA ligase [unclassified Erythrobacter]KZY94560.1 lysine--tRNA ligase [Erythrobacter sp. HI0074]KZZ08742.1 lysine--tRNA ligase [Erythrobacter sp. HI0077]
MSMNDLIAAARVSKAWPFQEAQRLLKRYPDGAKPDGSPVLFETGYGPSGLPHIGTFQEVLRTTLVRRAFEALIGARPEDGKTRLVAFSDDMDGLRKVPDNVPNPQLLQDNLHLPLSRVPNPFDSEHASFAAHNNAMLREFLDRFGFQYEFVSASDRYNSGAFDEALRQVLRKNRQILDIMLPTLREERRQTYSPVLPVSPQTARVLQVPVEVVDAEAGTIRFTDEDGTVVEQSALSGMSKLQWKVDWAMRWYALGVDYEMYGKDLTDSGVQSGKIVQVLGGRKPEGLIYELFLDENGEKISKSKGNGLTIDEWLTYGSEESLGFYIFPNPKSAKQLHVGVIPRAVDDYWQFRERLAEQELDKQLGNPVWHLTRANGGFEAAEAPGAGDSLPVTYGLLLNLASVLGAEASEDALRDYLASYIGDGRITPELEVLIATAVTYTRDYIVPTLDKRAPSANEAEALRALDSYLAQAAEDTSAEDLQTQVYEIGKREEYGFASLRDWFKALYQTLLGSDQGPRMGSFIALYGVANTRQLIAEALARQ